MEAFYIYIIKSSGLIALFYLAYHFMLRKETFFTSNRWFLLLGLFTSVLLPLVVFTKIIWVEPTPLNYDWSSLPITTTVNEDHTEEYIYLGLAVLYCMGALFLLTKFGFDFYSLQKVFKGKIIKRQADFKFIDLQDNLAPFSFFNTIVYNSSLYSSSELENILEHEKVHSEQNHTVDVLLSRLFCILFWFNPFIWLYKKAILQNLEFIADSEATKKISDKKAYQFTLLKITTHPNCVAITNHFYQSLIKKRIIMLNKNESHKRNLVKYTLILPLLIGFIFLFQIKVIAQEKKQSTTTNKTHSDNEVNVTLNKNTTDAEMKNDIAVLKKEYDITLKYSKVKRNSAGEITGIKAEFKDKAGNKGVSQVDGKEPIKPIHFYKNNKGIGFVSPKEVRVSTNHERIKNDFHTPVAVDDSITITDDFNLNFDIDFEVPEAPESPEAEGFTSNDNSNVIIKRINGKKPTIIINGKLIKNDKEIEEALRKYGGKGKGFSFSSSSDGDEKQLFINGKNMMKIKSDATADAEDQMKKMRPLVNKQKEMMLAQREKFKAEMERVKIEMKKSRADMDSKKPDMESYKADMEATKAEMQKAKIEMERAKLEFEKAKAELNTPKK